MAANFNLRLFKGETMGKKKIYCIAVPIAGCAYIEIEATYKAEAKQIAQKNITLDNIQLWGCYDKIFEGHCMHTPLYETKIKCIRIKKKHQPKSEGI